MAEMSEDELASRHETANWVPLIQEAVEQDKFRIFAQTIAPILVGEEGDRFEILVRYQSDDGKILPPGAFLPAAERFSLMSLLDKWVIDHSFQELDALYGKGGSRKLASASINLSGQTLGEGWLLEHVCQNFERTSIRPDQICFEVTETTAIGNLDIATRVMAQLRDLGCRFALDDFGSGLSSFSYLQDLPLDYLKIDGSLVKDIATNPVDKEMVTAIHKVAQVMDLKTVAEFVENDQILAVLGEIGVDYGQGYGIAKPIPLMEMGAAVVK